MSIKSLTLSTAVMIKAFYEDYGVDFDVLSEFSDFQNLMLQLRIYEYCKSIISGAILPYVQQS